MESDPDLKHAETLTAAFTDYQAGRLTADEFMERLIGLRQAKLARLQAQDPTSDP
jgi:hypothetical protein